MKKITRAKIVLSSLIIMYLYAFIEDPSRGVYNPKIEYETEDDSFGTYSGGRVYIGSKNYINSIKNEVSPNDILIVDESNGKPDEPGDPNYKILNSYKVVSNEERNEILLLLKKYDELNGTEWNRTMESLRNEWEVHNILYDLGLYLDHTEDVDLDNNDENLFSSKVLSMILHT